MSEPGEIAPEPQLGVGDKLMAALAFIHLGFVATFVSTYLDFIPPGEFANWISTYANMSGSFRDYTFFAPRVASATKAGFLVEVEGANPTLITLDSDSREMMFRFGCLIKSAMYDQRAQDLFAQSWAAVIFGSRPTAQTVTVIVESLRLPKMEEYRNGKRPEWRHAYVGRFTRR